MKSMRCLLGAIFFSFVFVSLFAFEELTVDSGEAEYDGKNIHLIGNVVVEHEMGKITSHQMTLLANPDGKKSRFSKINMQQDVQITFRDGGQLHSDVAELDYADLSGTFASDSDATYVKYLDSKNLSSEEKKPLEIKSHKMSILLGNDEPEGKPARNVLTSIKAQDDVIVNYNEEFTILADSANFERVKNAADLPTKIPGMITLYGTEEKECSIKNSKGDCILSKEVQVNTLKQQFVFIDPKGTLSGAASSENEEKNAIEFSANEMVWSEPSNQLTLKGQVLVMQKGFGNLSTDKEVLISREKVGDKNDLRSIECQGLTVITHLDELKDLSHVLTAYGRVFVDHKKNQTTMNTPYTKNGKANEKLQVLYEDHIGQIKANKMTLNYHMVDGNLTPTTLLLEGNVYIVNRFGSTMEEEKSYQQYAIADIVNYDFQTKKMEFSSLGKGRVLFFDKINNLQMSAPKLAINRDSGNSKESIKGYGDVRFHFIENEFEQIRKRFQYK